MKEKIRYFPVTSFAIVMGLSGLTIAFGKFYHQQWLPRFLYDFGVFTILALFLLFIVLYGLKLAMFPEEVKADFGHRIRINFFSAISISVLLLSVAFYTYYPFLSLILWWAGVLLHTVFMLKTIAFWIQHNFEIQHFNPAWFIPVVGNILIPITGVDYAPVAISFFYFAVGFFFWIILSAIFIYRVIFHAQLPEKFVPTFFILLAPPAVGFISYLRMTASWDSFAIFMLLLTYFFLALLAVLYKSFTRLKFFMSWWAFTFPLAATTIASVVAFQVTHALVFEGIAWIMLSVTILAILVVARQTFMHIRIGEICVKEE